MHIAIDQLTSPQQGNKYRASFSLPALPFVWLGLRPSAISGYEPGLGLVSRLLSLYFRRTLRLSNVAGPWTRRQRGSNEALPLLPPDDDDVGNVVRVHSTHHYQSREVKELKTSMLQLRVEAKHGC